MNNAFEQIIEKLEEAKSNVPVNRLLDDIIKDKPKELGQLIAYDKAIEIVKQESEQYNNGWIPCSERLPKNDCYCLVTTSDMEIGIREYGYSKGFGWDGFERIIAWQPLPQPYKPKGE